MAKHQRQYRLEDETIIQIELYSRLRRLNFNSFVETAVLEHAAKLEGYADWRQYTRHAHVPGAAQCAMFLRPDLSWDTDEMLRKQFVLLHKPFFYGPDGLPNERNLMFLWGKLDKYLSLWGEGKNAWAAGKKMAADMKAQGLVPPEWGPGVTDTSSGEDEEVEGHH